MSWRDRLLPAAFRGVGFSIEAADTTGGRRSVTHQYPGRDLPYVEDLGRRAREFQVDGFIVGEDYDRQRDALVEACEEPGPGTLSHPYRGTLQVVCTGITTREQVSEGRVVRISMQFVEAGQARQPRSSEDRLAKMDSAAAGVTDASEDVLESGFSLTGLPEFVRDDALGTLNDAANSVRDAIDNIGQATTEAVSAISFVQQNAETLVNAPGDMASAITDMINDVTGALSSAADALNVAEGLRTFYDEVEDILGNTTTRQQQRANRDALVAHIKAAALAASTRAASRVSWTSRQRAERRRDRLLDWIEDTQLSVTDPHLYTRLGELRARLVEAVPPPDQRLPNIKTVTLATTLPALVVSHRLYGDASRADDLVARNDVRHPSFVPGGVELEYLSRGE